MGVALQRPAMPSWTCIHTFWRLVYYQRLYFFLSGEFQWLNISMKCRALLMTDSNYRYYFGVFTRVIRRQQPTGACRCSLTPQWWMCWLLMESNSQPCSVKSFAPSLIKIRTTPSDIPWSLLDLPFVITGACKSARCWKFCLWCQRKLYSWRVD